MYKICMLCGNGNTSLRRLLIYLFYDISRYINLRFVWKKSVNICLVGYELCAWSLAKNWNKNQICNFWHGINHSQEHSMNCDTENDTRFSFESEIFGLFPSRYWSDMKFQHFHLLEFQWKSPKMVMLLDILVILAKENKISLPNPEFWRTTHVTWKSEKNIKNRIVKMDTLFNGMWFAFMQKCIQ